MLSTCWNCRFNLTPVDAFCPNCGNPAGHNPNFFNRKRFTIVAAIFAFMISIALPLIPQPLPAVIAITLSITMGVAFGIIVEIILDGSSKEHIATQPNALIAREVTIATRLDELDNRALELDSIAGQIRTSDSQPLIDVREKLLSAQKLVAEQKARYEIQKRKIELVRSQNKLSPFLTEHGAMTAEDLDHGIKLTDRIWSDVNRVKLEVTSPVSSYFPVAIEIEKSAFVEQLTQTLDSCGRIRESLITLRAARALSGVSPELKPDVATAKEVSVFNIQTSLTDFSDSFDELEREYNRLLAGQELDQKLLQQ